MRLGLFAGLAAVAAAADYEDDDINFLRLLSSNATGNTSATTVMAANTTTMMANTTTMMANTTMAATTVMAGNTTVAATTVMAANTTAAPVATTVASSGNASATTVAATTVAATTVATAAETTVPAATVDTLCSAAAYEMVGLAPPATMTTTAQTAAVIMTECDGASGLNADAATGYIEYGTASEAQANKDVCTTASGTATTYTCGGSTTPAMWNTKDMHYKKGILQFCCGASPSFTMPTVSGTIMTGGTVSYGQYTDSACATAAASLAWKEASIAGASSNPFTLNMDACIDGSFATGGAYLQFTMCNGTAADTNAMAVTHRYFDSACASYMRSGMVELGCKADSRRQLAAHGNGTSSGSSYTHDKWDCTATAATTLQFATTMSVDFAGLDSLDATQKTALKTTYEAKALSEFTAAVANTAATITDTHTYTGALASTRRRLNGRRLASHATGGVTSVFTTVLPAADATAAQTAVTTATATGGTLATAAFKTTIESELATNAATSAFASNITATVAPVVVSSPMPVAPSTGASGSSTSGAMANVLGFGSALFVAAAVLF